MERDEGYCAQKGDGPREIIAAFEQETYEDVELGRSATDRVRFWLRLPIGSRIWRGLSLSLLQKQLCGPETELL